LLLDEPAAGVPSLESHRILQVLDNLPEHIAILIIEHDMDLVFRFARRITVLVQGEVLVEGPPEEIAKDKRCIRFISANSIMPKALSLRDVRAGYGETVVLEDIAFELPERGAWRYWSERRRQDYAPRDHHGHTTFHAGSIEYQGKPIAGLPVYERCRLAWASYRRRATSSLPSRSRRTSPSPRAPAAGRWHASTISFRSSPSGAATGQPDLRRRTADARDRASADGQSDLLLMDEPLEGLAPIIVEVLLQACSA